MFFCNKPFCPFPDIHIIDGNSIDPHRTEKSCIICDPLRYAYLSVLIEKGVSCVSTLNAAVYVVPLVQHSDRILRNFLKGNALNLFS